MLKTFLIVIALYASCLLASFESRIIHYSCLDNNPAVQIRIVCNLSLASQSTYNTLKQVVCMFDNVEEYLEKKIKKNIENSSFIERSRLFIAPKSLWGELFYIMLIKDYLSVKTTIDTMNQAGMNKVFGINDKIYNNLPTNLCLGQGIFCVAWLRGYIQECIEQKDPHIIQILFFPCTDEILFSAYNGLAQALLNNSHASFTALFKNAMEYEFSKAEEDNILIETDKVALCIALMNVALNNHNMDALKSIVIHNIFENILTPNSSHDSIYIKRIRMTIKDAQQHTSYSIINYLNNLLEKALS